MPKVTIPFNQGAYVDDFDDGSNQFSFNLWPTFSEQQGSLTATKVQRTPGLVEFNVTAGGAYGGYSVLLTEGVGTLYGNWGLQLYRISPTGPAVLQTGSIVGNGYMSMVFNNQNIAAIIKGDNAYFFDVLTTTVLSISDATFTAIVGSEVLVAVVYLDGRFIFATERTLFVSSLETVNRGRDFNALETHEANYQSDPIRDLIVVDGYLWVIGQTTTEVYDTTGAAGFPLDRVENIILDKGGCIHGRSVELDDSIYMIARGKQDPYGVYVISGNSFIKISTDVIDQELEDNNLDVNPFQSNANHKLFTIHHDGHSFLGLYLGSNAGVTFVYDITESRRVGFPVWHQRGRTTALVKEWFGKDSVNIYNKNLVLGHLGTSPSFTGVAEIDSNVSTDLTNDVVRYVSCSYISNQADRVKIKRVTVRHKKKASGNLYLIMSQDRGVTTTSQGSRSMTNTLIWNRLGKSEDFSFIISNSSDLITPDANSNDVTLYDMILDVE